MPQSRLHSTLLKAAAYCDSPALLELEFTSGVVYQYFAVPPQVYGELLQAESKGGYFNHCIRNRYACVRLAGPVPALEGKGSCP